MHYREGLNDVTFYIRQNQYDMTVAWEIKPNEPRRRYLLAIHGSYARLCVYSRRPEVRSR